MKKIALLKVSAAFLEMRNVICYDKFINVFSKRMRDDSFDNTVNEFVKFFHNTKIGIGKGAKHHKEL